MVDLCPVVNWYLNGGLKTGLKNPVYGPKCLVLEWSAKSCDFTLFKLRFRLSEDTNNTIKRKKTIEKGKEEERPILQTLFTAGCFLK